MLRVGIHEKKLMQSFDISVTLWQPMFFKSTNTRPNEYKETIRKLLWERGEGAELWDFQSILAHSTAIFHRKSMNNHNMCFCNLFNPCNRRFLSSQCPYFWWSEVFAYIFPETKQQDSETESWELSQISKNYKAVLVCPKQSICESEILVTQMTHH